MASQSIGPVAARERACLVSVCMITYNQERFVVAAVESVLSQDVDFEYELVISDDASTDQTSEILKKYAAQHPDIIRLDCRLQNIGAAANFFDTLNRCTGKYVAILEGDDYWTDDSKLKRQVEFMERNTSISIIHHNVWVLSADGNRRQKHCVAPPRVSQRSLFRSNPVCTVSVLFRRSAAIVYPACMKHLKIVDRFLYILLAGTGTVFYMDRIMAVYRMHPGGVYSGLGTREKLERRIAGMQCISSCVEERERQQLQRAISELYLTMALIRLVKERNRAGAWADLNAARAHLLDFLAVWNASGILSGLVRDALSGWRQRNGKPLNAQQ